MFIQALNRTLREDGLAIDYHLARYVYEQINDDEEHIKILIASTCMMLYQAQQQGHSALPCISAYTRVNKILGTLNLQSHNIDFKEFYALLHQHAWVCNLENFNQQANKPLVLLPTKTNSENQLLSLQRNYHIEKQISIRLLYLQQQNVSIKNTSTDEKRAHASLDILDHDQLMACKHSLDKHFSVISGGPGSGKTSTIFSIICHLLFSDPRTDETKPIRIALAACTGKAATRLNQSIQQRLSQSTILSSTESTLLKQQQLQAKTLHRLLGFSHKRQKFKYNQQNLLAIDVLIVDEISMLDFNLLHALLNALPMACKLILIGDQNQLPAIEHGDLLTTLSSSPLKHAVTYLHGQYRFAKEAHIGQLLTLIQSKELGNKLPVFFSQSHDQSLEFIDYNGIDSVSLWRRLVTGYEKYFEVINDTNKDIIEKINALNDFQILCPFHDGEFAVENINRILNQTFKQRMQHDTTAHAMHYSGQPIMISHNDYHLDLFNGDMGVILYDQYSSRFKAYFMDDGLTELDSPPKPYRVFELNQLPQYQLCYAMSIHKAQGSEFQELMLLIPSALSPQQSKLLQRKLIYTGISRAQKKVTLCAELDSLIDACNTNPKNYNSLTALLNADP